jgi:Flp pilus assembly protein TadG
VTAQVVVCSVVILGMGALVIDVGKLYVARSELQRAADSAALAGTSAYLDNAGLLQSLTLGELARERAQTYSLANWTYGVPTVLDTGDIVVGTLDLTDPDGTLDTSGTQRFNAVQVLVRRTADSSNGAIGYSFARIFGHADGGVVAAATAAYDDRFSGFRQTPHGPMIPFTIHEDIYEDLLVNGPDEYSWDKVEKQVEYTPDEVREIRLFPYRAKLHGGDEDGAGNFGILNIGTGNQGDAAIEVQIREGVAPSDLETEIGTSTLTFVGSGGQPVTYDITGSPGLKAGMEGAMASRVGDVVGFFLHDLVTLTGSNAVFRIVDVRFGRVMYVDLNGNPNDKCLVIQPVAYTGQGVFVDVNAPSSDGQVGRLRLVR